MQRPAEWDQGEPLTEIPKAVTAAEASSPGTEEPGATSAVEGQGRASVGSASQAMTTTSTIPEWLVRLVKDFPQRGEGLVEDGPASQEASPQTAMMALSVLATQAASVEVSQRQEPIALRPRRW